MTLWQLPMKLRQLELLQVWNLDYVYCLCTLPFVKVLHPNSIETLWNLYEGWSQLRKQCSRTNTMAMKHSYNYRSWLHFVNWGQGSHIHDMITSSPKWWRGIPNLGRFLRRKTYLAFDFYDSVGQYLARFSIHRHRGRLCAPRKGQVTA